MTKKVIMSLDEKQMMRLNKKMLSVIANAKYLGSASELAKKCLKAKNQ